MHYFSTVMVGIMVFLNMLLLINYRDQIIEAIEQNSVQKSLSPDYNYTLDLKEDVIIVRDGTDVYIVEPDSLEEFIYQNNM